MILNPLFITIFHRHLYTALMCLFLLVFSHARSQQAVACYDSRGNMYSVGSSWTDVHNGVNYHCRCTSSGPSCTPTSSGGGSTYNFNADLQTTVAATMVQGLINWIFSDNGATAVQAEKERQEEQQRQAYLMQLRIQQEKERKEAIEKWKAAQNEGELRKKMEEEERLKQGESILSKIYKTDANALAGKVDFSGLTQGTYATANYNDWQKTLCLTYFNDLAAKSKDNTDAAFYREQAKLVMAGKPTMVQCQAMASKDNEYAGRIEKVKGIVDYLRANPQDAEVKVEQFKMENQPEEWLNSKDEDILKSLSRPDPYVADLNQTIKTNTPPPLSVKTLDDLRAGDVILVSPASVSLKSIYHDDLPQTLGALTGQAISFVDNKFSGTKANISHTLIYLKEVNGKKLYLDNVPGKGPTIISDQEFQYIYGKRDLQIAQIARPLSEEQGAKLYSAAREIADKQLQNKSVIGTTYGLVGDDMVCSVSNRWALVKAGVQILPETQDKVKNFFGMAWSPADFTKSSYFIITPLTQTDSKK